MKATILFGGSSFEHEISIVSAITLKERLKDWELTFLFLDKDRNFYLIDPQNLKSSHFSSGSYRKGKRAEIGRGGFYLTGFLGGRKRIEGGVVINLIHGRDGEDGKIPGMLQFYRIPTVTPSVEGCAVSYNKVLTKYYARGVGVEVVEFVELELDHLSTPPRLPFSFPVIVKPARLGSSLGVSVARSEEELQYGLDSAREFDSTAVVEPFLEGVEEYNLAGCRIGEEWHFSRVEKVQKGEFLDYNQKYLDFGRKEVELPPVEPELEEKLKGAFKKIYGHTFQNALIRCDFFRHGDRIYLNEINPIPGSLAHYLFDDFEEVLERLAKSVELEREIEIDYRYIHQIQRAKGK